MLTGEIAHEEGLHGLTQRFPVLPDGRIGNTFVFRRGGPGWYDPPMTFGYRYRMDNDVRFTAIDAFPEGIDGDDTFTVHSGGLRLGDFTVGETVDFEAITGGPVDEFTVTGITPLVESGDPTAFPLKIAFDAPDADFRMTPIELPAPVVGRDVAGNLILTWSSDSDVRYQLQTTQDMVEWKPVGDPVRGTGEILSLSLPVDAGNPSMHYRLALQ